MAIIKFQNMTWQLQTAFNKWNSEWEWRNYLFMNATFLFVPWLFLIYLNRIWFSSFFISAAIWCIAAVAIITGCSLIMIILYLQNSDFQLFEFTDYPLIMKESVITATAIRADGNRQRPSYSSASSEARALIYSVNQAVKQVSSPKRYVKAMLMATTRNTVE